ncbi:MAG TPA: 16S rRNA (guanine(527)-N(7))-methyltransferase RsmG [Terriglobia bacterium]|nr:16S rRNA (guanine(527)-N(7))-methyltransferase RsmG [Terriglobia bacterium]
MHPARIAELLHPFLSPTQHSEPGQRPGDESDVLSEIQSQNISTYIDILLRWNSRINLTAIRDEEHIVTRHFGESLFAARLLFPPVPFANQQPLASPIRLADLGSGAGFPGIPIKLWNPNVSLTLIESNHKKATFLREVVRTLTLTDVDIQNVRAESLPASSFDIVTLRAVERFADALPVAARLLTPEGRLALLIASSQVSVATSTFPSLHWIPPTPIPASRERVVLLGRRNKISEQVGSNTH